MSHGIRFDLNDSLFLRDPQTTPYGHKLLNASIDLLCELGFEAFTFKKLAKEISSTETSIYRYFENKHYLLLFLTSWYWEWVNYLIELNTRNIDDPKRKLEIIIENITHATQESPLTKYINENKLHQIIINESSKAYHTHMVDEENACGIFLSFKDLVHKVSSVMKEVNPNFGFTSSLASNLFEMANNQIYFMQHLPRLTDLKPGEDHLNSLSDMMKVFTFKILS